MVLYEDLRIYTIWRTDMARAKATNDPAASSGSSTNTLYAKSAEEWEILGELAERLHHFNEAIEAYQNCLRIRFSPKAMRAVVKMFEQEKKSESVLQGMIRLIAWQYRWYSEVGPATLLAKGAFTNQMDSFHRSCFASSGNSSRRRELSRCGVSCKQLAFHSRSWI